jgi:hypothetical protein
VEFWREKSKNYDSILYLTSSVTACQSVSGQEFYNYLTPPFPKGSLWENDGAKHIPTVHLSF